MKYVHLTPRLSAALSMLEGAETVADIGCDHGRLSAALLQQNVCSRVIATDISEPSLRKAQRLLSYIGVSERVSFRLGDGLHVIEPFECDAIAMLGMGGTLMVQILARCPIPLNGANSVVLQPMRAQADIREYLHLNDFRITHDCIVSEHGRYYQIFRAVPNMHRQPLPDGFPEGFYDVGFQSFANRDPNLKTLCEAQLMQHRKRIAAARGTEGEEKLSFKIRSLERILNLLSEE